MKQFFIFLKNLAGVILLILIVFFLTKTLNYFTPLLIDKGWLTYILVGLLYGTVTTLLILFQTLLFVPILHLITSKFAKVLCAIITIIGLILTIYTPWQFANVIGFSFIVIVWAVTLTIFIIGLFLVLLFAIFSSNE